MLDGAEDADRRRHLGEFDPLCTALRASMGEDWAREIGLDYFTGRGA